LALRRAGVDGLGGGSRRCGKKQRKYQEQCRAHRVSLAGGAEPELPVGQADWPVCLLWRRGNG
jgi:hypothetical protein